MYTIKAIFPDGIKAECSVLTEQEVHKIILNMESLTVYTVYHNNIQILHIGDAP